jgi:drug/metabolite transporter (DMT)-like permease
MLTSSMLGFGSMCLYGARRCPSRPSRDDLRALALYPAVTVLLAFWLLGERLIGEQRLGIVAVVIGVVLMSAA